MTKNEPRPNAGQVEKLITFLYYKDLPKAMRFYEDVLGFKVAIDQGWCKIYGVSADGYVGLVDETRGMHKAHPVKPVQICMRVPDVDAWHAYLKGLGVEGLTAAAHPAANSGSGPLYSTIRKGYQIEIQSAI